MSRIVLLPFGSAGDVFPFIWLGKLLKARGHRVTMVSTCLFSEAVEAVKRLGIRAVFVTRMENRVPPGMETQSLQVDFVPFGKLLEHASVSVHHGGVGTMAQGFRAGVPQLVMAMAHDQPDNAARLEKLGAGIGLTPRSFTPDRVTRELRRLLDDSSFAEAAEVLKVKTEVRRDEGELVGWIDCRMHG